ncbi:MAG: sensor histidine kinase [Candidatus Binatia bacterium]
MVKNTPDTSNPLRGFNLTRQFAILSFICIAALTGALWMIASYYLSKEMLEREWDTTATFVRTEANQLVSSEDFKTPDYSAVAHKFARLHQQVTMMPEIVRIKVYNSQGVIIWSDEKRLIGAAFRNNPELEEALEGEIVAEVSPIVKGENVYERGAFSKLVEVYVPIYSKKGREIVGIIETYRLAETLFKDIQRARLVILLAAILGGLLLYFSLFAIVKRASNKISEQQQNLLTMQSELVASQRMAAIGEMAAAVAHGIGNPLSSIRAAAQVAKLECEQQIGCDQSEKTQKNLSNIIGEVDRVENRIRGLLNFSRPLEPHFSLVDINAVVRETVEALRTRFERSKITPRLELDPTLPKATLDPFHVEQILLGLLTNAIEATPPGGTVTVMTGIVPSQASSHGVRISIEDTGEGIPPESHGRIFEPFFTTKPQGTGIGLPLTKKFVERNGGVIAISKGSKGGTRVDFTLPIAGPNRR